MHIVPIDQIHPELVKSMAEFAADLGQDANPFPQESPRHHEWNEAFAARVRANAEECAS